MFGSQKNTKGEQNGKENSFIISGFTMKIQKK